MLSINRKNEASPNGVMTSISECSRGNSTIYTNTTTTSLLTENEMSRSSRPLKFTEVCPLFLIQAKSFLFGIFYLFLRA